MATGCAGGRLLVYVLPGTVGRNRDTEKPMPDSTRTCRVLLIYPRFSAATFWNFSVACELVGARYPAAPLGLITLAACLPQSWDLRLVNRNTEELTPADLDW